MVFPRVTHLVAAATFSLLHACGFGFEVGGRDGGRSYDSSTSRPDTAVERDGSTVDDAATVDIDRCPRPWVMTLWQLESETSVVRFSLASDRPPLRCPDLRGGGELAPDAEVAAVVEDQRLLVFSWDRVQGLTIDDDALLFDHPVPPAWTASSVEPVATLVREPASDAWRAVVLYHTRIVAYDAMGQVHEDFGRAIGPTPTRHFQYAAPAPGSPSHLVWTDDYGDVIEIDPFGRRFVRSHELDRPRTLGIVDDRVAVEYGGRIETGRWGETLRPIPRPAACGGSAEHLIPDPTRDEWLIVRCAGQLLHVHIDSPALAAENPIAHDGDGRFTTLAIVP